MSVNITENIKSISDLKNQTQEIFDQIHRTGQPVMVTVNGKPDVVLLDAEVYERTIQALNLRTLLAEAEIDIKKGNTRPARAFLEELKANAKISG